MILLHRLDRFLLSSILGKTLLRLVATTAAAVQLGVPADPEQSLLLVNSITVVNFVFCRTWCGVSRSEVERAVRVDVAAVAAARSYLTLLERKGLTADFGQVPVGLSDEGLLQ